MNPDHVGALAHGENVSPNGPGDADEHREGLADTPARVIRAYEDWFSGYAQDPIDQLQRTFEEVGGFERSCCCGRFRSNPIASTTSRRSSAMLTSAISPNKT
jgi:hypothetical protein